MKLEQSFEVEAPMDEVWAALIDVERVAPCLPGAAVTGRNDDGSYNGTFTIKIGPTTASYAGKLEMQNVNGSEHTATMHAQGSDKRGQGGATATISSRLTSVDAGTRVEVVTDYHITGRLARFGRGGMIEDISERLLRDFAGRLQSSLAGSGAAADEQPTVESPRAAEAPPAPAEAPPAPTETAPEPVETAPAPTETAPEPVESAPEPVETAEPAPSPATPPPSAEAARPRPPEPAPSPPAEAAPPPPPSPGPAPPAAGPPPPAAGPPPPLPHGSPSTPPSAESAPPVQGLSLMGGVMLDRVKRNPKPLVAIAGGLVLLRVLSRRR